MACSLQVAYTFYLHCELQPLLLVLIVVVVIAVAVRKVLVNDDHIRRLHCFRVKKGFLLWNLYFFTWKMSYGFAIWPLKL